MTKNLAIIPVKGLLDSKSRLSRSLGPQDKKKLVIALLEDVLTAVKESELFNRVLVVSPDPNVAEEAKLPHGSFLHQEGQELNAGVRQSTHFALGEEAGSSGKDTYRSMSSGSDDTCHGARLWVEGLELQLNYE